MGGVKPGELADGAGVGGGQQGVEVTRTGKAELGGDVPVGADHVAAHMRVDEREVGQDAGERLGTDLRVDEVGGGVVAHGHHQQREVAQAHQRRVGEARGAAAPEAQLGGDLDAGAGIKPAGGHGPGEGNGEDDLDHRRRGHRVIGVEVDLGRVVVRTRPTSRAWTNPRASTAANVAAIWSRTSISRGGWHVAPMCAGRTGAGVREVREVRVGLHPLTASSTG